MYSASIRSPRFAAMWRPWHQRDEIEARSGKGCRISFETARSTMRAFASGRERVRERVRACVRARVRDRVCVRVCVRACARACARACRAYVSGCLDRLSKRWACEEAWNAQRQRNTRQHALTALPNKGINSLSTLLITVLSHCPKNRLRNSRRTPRRIRQSVHSAFSQRVIGRALGEVTRV